MEEHKYTSFESLRLLNIIILFSFHLKTDKLYYSRKEEEGKTFHSLQIFGMNEDSWNMVGGLGNSLILSFYLYTR